MPREIWELIKWVGIISAIGIWIIVIIRLGWNFLFKDIERKSKG
ncbi:MAG: hypothetical protein ACW97P_12020 [Candidatus Hodarchaeales archaeon]|jgi:hypothetical protein